MLRFLISVGMIILLLGLTTLYGSHQAWWGLPTFWIEILFFTVFMTIVIFYYLNRLRNSQPEAFTQFYLLSIVLKMMGGLALIFFIVWDDPSGTTGNATLFIISYLILTFLEVYFLLSRSGK